MVLNISECSKCEIVDTRYLLQFVMFSIWTTLASSLLNIMLVAKFYKIMELESSVVEFLQTMGYY